MLFLEQRITADVVLAIWKIVETEDELLALFPTYGELFRREIDEYRSLVRRLEFLSVRALLVHLLGDENNVFHDEDGRPSLLDRSLNISISHTKGYAAVVLGRNRVVGVDIEQKRDKIFRVKHKFLSEKELGNIDMENELDSLLLHWCAKETVYKMADKLLPEFSEEIAIDPFSVGHSSTGSFIAREVVSGIEYKMSYQLFPEFVMTYSFV